MKMETVCFEGAAGASLRVGVADSFFLRLRGLLGRDVRMLGGLMISPCNQIHTCFMSYPIDVVYLDADDSVLQVDAAVRPWHFCKAVRGAKKVLELPENGASKRGVVVGEKVSRENAKTA